LITKLIQQILPFLNKVLPTSIALKGLSKVDPRFERFFTQSAAAGFSTNAALDFLRSKFESSGEQEYKQTLKSRIEQGIARPDERASFEKIRQSQVPLNLAQKGISLATGLAAGIPGLQPQESDKETAAELQASQKQAAPTQPEQRGSVGVNEFAKRHPMLAKFVKTKLDQGLDLLDAAGEARANKKLRKEVDEVERTTQQPLENVLSYLFDVTQKAAQQPKSDLTGDLSRVSELIRQYQAKKKRG
jgi:hypothetical protein